MSARLSLRLALPLVLLLLAGCVTPLGGQSSVPATSNSEIQDQVFKLQKDTARLIESVDEVKAKLSGPTAPNACAEAAARVQSLEREMRVLEEQLLDGQRRLDEVLTEVRALRRSGIAVTAPPIVVQQPQPLPPPAPAAADAGTQPSEADGDATPALGLSGSSPAQLFNAAYSDYSQRHYELALQGFQAAYQADPSGPTADDAQYWTGETLFAMGRWQDAVDAFDRLIQGVPKSEKVPAAYLKKGLALFETRRTGDAVGTLQKLIESWPGSDEARIAREHLRRRGITS